MFWPLMKDCITDQDKQDLINFIKTSDSQLAILKKINSIWKNNKNDKYGDY